MTLHDILGWLGTICFILCVVPQTVICIRDKTAGSLSWPFLVMWLGGLVTMLAYVVPERNWPLIANYGFGLVNVAIILRYKLLDAGFRLA